MCSVRSYFSQEDSSQKESGKLKQILSFVIQKILVSNKIGVVYQIQNMVSNSGGKDQGCHRYDFAESLETLSAVESQFWVSF